MPELPEVETVRRGLEARVVGRRIVHVDVGRDRVVRRTSAAVLRAGLTDRVVVGAGRRGKYLLCPLDSGHHVMIHLRMSGQVLLQDARTPRPLHTHVAATLDDGIELRFVDPRTFGEVVVFDPSRVDEVLPEVARLGVDPLVDDFSVEVLRTLVKRRRGALKPFLLDQHVIAGIGNIYADEILHRARLHPLRRTDTLRSGQVRALHEAVVTVLDDAVAAGGSTLADSQYVDVDGAGGAFQDRHRVYARAGQRCLTCGKGTVRRVVIAQRSSHLCPWCQQLRRIGTA